MDQFIANLPKGLFAVGVLILALVFIIVSNPPQTICSSQMEIFKESQSGFLFSKTEKGFERKAKLDELFESCKLNNGPGSCADLFEKMHKLISDLTDLGSRCENKVDDISEIRKAIFGTLDLMTRLAWGDQGPRNYAGRVGWFDTSDLMLFCALRKKATQIYGEESMQEFRNQLLGSLPATNKISMQQVASRSLYDLPCQNLR